MENNSITFYEWGTQVCIWSIDTPGIITGILLSDNQITYRVAYYKGSIKIENFFHPYELSFNSNAKVKSITNV